MNGSLKPTCSNASCVAQLEARTRRARRGGQEVTYVSLVWSCGACEDPETGESPLRFTDAQLAMINESTLTAAWAERFGEPVPTGAAALRLRDLGFDGSEMAWIEEHRGNQSVPEFLRGLVQQRQRQAG